MDAPKLIDGHEALIRALSVQGELSLEDQRAVSSIPMTLRFFSSGDFIGREGRSVSTCAVLIRGFAVRQKLTGLGDCQIVSLHGPGDALNFQNAFLEVPDYDVRSVEDCVAAFFDASAMRVLAAERSAVANSLLIGAFTEASTAREWMLNLGRRNARTRLAHFLCEYLDRISLRQHPADGRYKLRLTQEQIGDATGMTSVHVNRMLKDLQSDKLIKQLNRCLIVPDMAALMDAGEYNRRYLHLTQAKFCNAPASF
ncbi:Crp/Fnr family transcriptional regulator [Sphingomonas faeni]|uniref:Crp/Fnr family transcriptional regulator n=1 Tax=Sphingomonas faeni TaxID=185950 RepID=UPI00334C99B8